MVKESLKRNPAEIVVFGLTEDYYDENNRFHHSEKILPEQHYFSEQDELREYIIELEKRPYMDMHGIRFMTWIT